MPKSVFIIIPVHNRKLISLNCLKTLQQNGDLEHYRVVVVDDGSTDGTEQAIRFSYPDVTVLKGDGNLWWTGAMIQGMQFAIEQGAKYLIWLNDDCTPDPNTLPQLVEFCRTHQNTIAGAACYLSDTRQLHPTGAKGRNRKAARPGESVNVDEMSGHCVCIPVAVTTQIGLPNMKHFPHYHGDSMYILKATRSGFSAYILGDAPINHSGIIKSNIKDFCNIQNYSSFINKFSQVFLSKKSLYYLPTQFFYYLEKYGLIKGLPIFSLKFFWWLKQLIELQLISATHHVTR